MSSSLLMTYGFYLLIGVFTGLLAGVMGIGGGIIVVPALLMIFQYHYHFPLAMAMPMAAGTSLAIMMFTSQASIRAHYQLGDILWSVYFRLLAGLIVGTILGGICASIIPTGLIEILLAIFLLAIAGQMLFKFNPRHPRHFPNPWINGLISTFIGFQAGLLGIGGGTLVISYLSYCGIDMRKIVAISSLCTMTVSIIGTITFMIVGSTKAGLPIYSTGYVYWPAVVGIGLSSCLIAPIGARLTYVISIKKLHYGFIVILLLTAINLLF